MNSSAQSNVTSDVKHGAVNRIADMAGRKVADLAIQKALPALRNMNPQMKRNLTIVALAAVGFILIRSFNRESIQM